MAGISIFSQPPDVRPVPLKTLARTWRSVPTSENAWTAWKGASLSGNPASADFPPRFPQGRRHYTVRGWQTQPGRRWTLAPRFRPQTKGITGWLGHLSPL